MLARHEIVFDSLAGVGPARGREVGRAAPERALSDKSVSFPFPRSNGEEWDRQQLLNSRIT
jgi:hypothetical protein